jgi:hypothetical protein
MITYVCIYQKHAKVPSLAGAPWTMQDTWAFVGKHCTGAVIFVDLHTKRYDTQKVPKWISSLGFKLCD